MANFNQTASAESAISGSGSDLHTPEAFVLALTRGLDDVFKREFERPKQGMRYLMEKSIKQESANYQTYRSIGGVVGVNRDADDLPFVTRADGFGWNVKTYNYRQAIGIEKTLQEVDDVGVIRGLQTDLMENANLTQELAVADVFNRGVNPTNAPILCDDGMYLCDKDRPNADPAAGTWDNEYTASAITPASIFTAQLNARAVTDEHGELSPRFIKKIICRPNEEKTLWELQKSDKEVGTANNTANFHMGRFEIEVYDFLTDAAVYFLLGDPKSDSNELGFYWRVKPELTTWKDGSNPDITKQRIRFAFGMGCGSPRKTWAGMEVS